MAEAALAALGGEGVVVVHEHHGVDIRFAANTVTTNGVRHQRRVTVVAVRDRSDGRCVGVASGSGAVVAPGTRTGAGAGAGAGVGSGGGRRAVGVVPTAGVVAGSGHGSGVSPSAGGTGRLGPSSSPVAAGTGASQQGWFSWRQLVEAAEADAAGSEPADDAFDLVQGPAAADFAEPAGRSAPAVLAGIATGLGDSFDQALADGLVVSGFAEHAEDTVYVASTTGLRLRHAQPTGKVQVVLRTTDGTASSWVGVGTEDVAGVSLDGLLGEARRRLSWAARRVELPPGRYPTVLPPDAVADLVCMLGEAAVGREAEEGRGVFSAPGGGTRVGEQLLAMPMELRADPFEPGLPCTPFVVTTASGSDTSVFDNGLALERTAYLREGRLAQLRYHRAGAARAGVAPAPRVDNLVLELPGATETVDDLVRSVDRGLLVTCLWYIREVDPATLLLTGLTRDGVYLVERGEVVGAVNNFRFNESPLGVLQRASAVGATERALSREWNEWFPRTAMPPVLVPDFNMSSVSPAI